MEEQLISYETAKLAKEKGFNVETLHFYCKNRTCDYIKTPYKYSFEVNANQETLINGEIDNFGYGITWSAPTQSLLQKWLREKHQIIVDVSLDFFNSYTKESIKYSPTFYTYSNNKKRFWIYTDYINSDECTKKMQEEMPIFQNYSTYEEALEIALFEALKLIK